MRSCMIVCSVLGWATLLTGVSDQPSFAQAPPPQLDDTVKLGGIATLAPLCGLREEAWAVDLRRAAIQAATQSKAHDDPDLKAAPGSNLAVGALSYADTEATESFAEADPAETCKPLASSPDLARADVMVEAFRKQGAGPRAW